MRREEQTQFSVLYTYCLNCGLQRCKPQLSKDVELHWKVLISCPLCDQWTGHTKEARGPGQADLIL